MHSVCVDHLLFVSSHTCLLFIPSTCRHGFDKFYGTPCTHCEGPPSYPAVPVFDDETKIGRIGIGEFLPDK